MDPPAIDDRNPAIPTLRTLALRRCVLNANNFVSLGDLPYILVQPILQACSATHLAQLEDASPDLREDTQDLWEKHVSEKFRASYTKRDDEDWRGLYERLKFEQSERLREATARLRAKNGKLKEEKLAKQIVVIDPKKVPVKGERKRQNPFGGMRSTKRNITHATGHGSPTKKKNSIFEKARRDTSLSKLNYATAPKFSATKPGINSIKARLSLTNPVPKRREPAPPNDKNIFGHKPIKAPTATVPHQARSTQQITKNSFFEALRK